MKAAQSVLSTATSSPSFLQKYGTPKNAAITAAVTIASAILFKKIRDAYEDEDQEDVKPIAKSVHVGLLNDSATCYLNSLLQMLFHLPVFRTGVFKMSSSTAMARALQRTFYDLQFHNNEAISTERLTKSFGWSRADRAQQQDIQELIRKLFESIEKRLQGTKNEKLLEKLFCGTSESIIRCTKVPYSSSREERFYDLQLNIVGTLRNAMLHYIKPELLTGDNKYNAGEYGLQEAQKGTVITSLPPVLMLHLKRFEFSITSGRQYKVNDPFQFEDEIDLNEFVVGKNSSSIDYTYTLHGVLVHRGTVDAGHYFAFINTATYEEGKEYKKSWHKFNDSQVLPASAKEAIQDNCGGIDTAYMLVYIRKSEIPQLLKPVTFDDVPQKLKERISKENKEGGCNIL